jgi:hypothetical protein
MTNARTRLTALTATALFAFAGVGAGSALAIEIPAGDTPDPVEHVGIDTRPDFDVTDVIAQPSHDVADPKPIDTTDPAAHLGDLVVAPKPADNVDVTPQPGDTVIVPLPERDPVIERPSRHKDPKPARGVCPAGEPAITARVTHTSITAPPSGGGRQALEITGADFRPGTTLKIVLHNYPAADGSQVDVELSATTDEQGHLMFTADLSKLPQRNMAGDAEVDVWVTVTDGNGCAAMTHLKAGQILNPPLA